MQIRLRRREKKNNVIVSQNSIPKISSSIFFRYFCFLFCFQKGVVWASLYLSKLEKKNETQTYLILLVSIRIFNDSPISWWQFECFDAFNICIYQALKTVTFILTIFIEKKIAWIKIQFFFPVPLLRCICCAIASNTSFEEEESEKLRTKRIENTIRRIS